MSNQLKPVLILVLGCGNMGASHAIAYHNDPGFEVLGLVSRGKSKEVLNARMGNRYPLFNDMDEAMEAAPFSPI